MDAVVVTAEKADADFQTGDVDTEQISGFSSVIKREEFEGKMEDLSEIIEKEAGVQIHQSGGLGSFSTVSLRGSSSEQVVIYMDGVPLNEASGGGVNLSNISLSDIASLEIYRGITPVNFGKSSVGGVINIKTLRAEKGLHASAGGGYGSFNARSLSAFVNHKPDKWDYLISADYLDADNDFEFLNDNGTELNPLDDRWEDRNNAEFDQKNILGKLGYDFTKHVRADFHYQWFSKNQGLPNWRNSEKVDTSLDTERNISTLKLTANDLGSHHLNTSTRFSFFREEEIYDDRGNYIGLSGDQHNKYITTRYEANFFLEWLTEFNSVSLLLDEQHEIYESENMLGKEKTDDKSRDTFSIGLQDSVFLFQDKLMLTPGIRCMFLKDDSEDDETSRDETYFMPQFGLRYRPMQWLTFKTNVAKYVREPSFFELFGDRGFFYGNEDLKAEKGINFDAGAEITRKTSHDWLKRFSLNLVYFRSDVDDLITRIYTTQGYGRSENVSSSCIQGIEAGIKLDFFDIFRLIANATWQDTENESEKKDADGKKLPGRFEESYLTRLEAKYKALKLHTEYIVEKDGYYYDTPNLLKAEDKEEINAGISWLFKSFLLTFEAKNLGDDHYEDFNGYPLPGRSYFVSIKYNY
ncbi:TonB-dependent receptor plug domain-containing protein [Desulfonema magnum]|uniref:TonB-dependent receptor plug domain-containing protein n=1 Tax=Desulfonema magnum TaxID=45655 RepID=A0A975BIE0_9BACT|nr:TonB-dependent receptor plug domain-containing protein [Desulfonema magnum]